MPAIRPRTNQTFRLLTTLAGLAMFIVVSLQTVAVVGGHRPAPGEPTLRQAVVIDLHALLLFGLLLAAGWEGVGGLAVVLASVGMCIAGPALGSAGLEPLGVLGAVLGMAFLACGWPSSHARPEAIPTGETPARGQGIPTLASTIARGIYRRARQPGRAAHWLPGRGPAHRLEMARARLESGQGGDVERAERPGNRPRPPYVPGLMRTMSAWVRLRERVERGNLGGEDDGAATRGTLPPAS